jgi:hypothetical protein
VIGDSCPTSAVKVIVERWSICAEHEEEVEHEQTKFPDGSRNTAKITKVLRLGSVGIPTFGAG